MHFGGKKECAYNGSIVAPKIKDWLTVWYRTVTASNIQSHWRCVKYGEHLYYHYIALSFWQEGRAYATQWHPQHNSKCTHWQLLLIRQLWVVPMSNNLTYDYMRYCSWIIRYSRLLKKLTEIDLAYLNTMLIFLEHICTWVTASISLQEFLSEPTIEALIIFPFKVSAALSNTIHFSE